MSKDPLKDAQEKILAQYPEATEIQMTGRRTLRFNFINQGERGTYIPKQTHFEESLVCPTPTMSVGIPRLGQFMKLLESTKSPDSQKRVDYKENAVTQGPLPAIARKYLNEAHKRIKAVYPSAYNIDFCPIFDESAGWYTYFSFKDATLEAKWQKQRDAGEIAPRRGGSLLVKIDLHKRGIN